MSVMSRHLESKLGEPVAILCARYWYRGILKEYDDDAVLLINARAVEQTGSATGSEPDQEDVIPSDLVVRLSFVEQVCQPTWVWHDMGNAKAKKTRAVTSKT